jgi:Flp pilus assembly protein TadB
MAENLPTTESPPSMTELVQGIIADTQNLIRQEITLARTEIQKDWKDLQQAGMSLGVGGALALLGGGLLALFVVSLLHEVLTLPWWVSFLIVGAVLAVTGGVFLAMGIQKMKQVEIGPEQTIQTIKEII